MFFTFPIPGIIPRISLKLPNFFTCSSCDKKSSNVKLWLSNFSCIFFASSSSILAWAFSISVRTSPIPKIRDAIRSGWNNSRSFIFSPIPTNLIGFPVIDLIDNAAPPRVSPSSFVRTRPVISNCSSNDVAILTASCPIIASTTSRISSGFTADFISFNSSISSSSI